MWKVVLLMVGRKYKIYKGLIFILLLVLSSACVDESFVSDNLVQHPIKPGTYDFVFLANEATDTYILNRLNSLTKYDGLNHVAYPASVFTSEKEIPMIQEIEDVTILPNKQALELNDGTQVSVLELALDRIILPSSMPADKSLKSEAVLFTVNMGNNYNPSCELQISPNPVDYSFPPNTKLDLIGTIRDALHVNIEASDWSTYGGPWSLGNKKLNVSHTKVSITDFNGARISFWSNMPQVKVLPDVFIGAGNSTGTTTQRKKNKYQSIGNDSELKII